MRNLIQKSIDENFYISYRNASDYLFKYFNSETKMRGLMELKNPIMEKPDFLKLFGEEWNCCDLISEYTDEIKEITGIKYNEKLMNNEEKEAYDLLENEVAIYRSSSFHGGICWSLKKEVALAFTTYARYKTDNMILFTAKVKKEYIVALKLDRNEHEIITFKAKIISEEKVI